MQVKAMQDCDGHSHVMKAGRVYEVKDRIGYALIADGLCEPFTGAPDPEPAPEPEPEPAQRVVSTKASKRERRG